MLLLITIFVLSLIGVSADNHAHNYVDSNSFTHPISSILNKARSLSGNHFDIDDDGSSVNHFGYDSLERLNEKFDKSINNIFHKLDSLQTLQYKDHNLLKNVITSTENIMERESNLMKTVQSLLHSQSKTVKMLDKPSGLLTQTSALTKQDRELMYKLVDLNLKVLSKMNEIQKDTVLHASHMTSNIDNQSSSGFSFFHFLFNVIMFPIRMVLSILSLGFGALKWISFNVIGTIVSFVSHQVFNLLSLLFSFIKLVSVSLFPFAAAFVVYNVLRGIIQHRKFTEKSREIQSTSSSPVSMASEQAVGQKQMNVKAMQDVMMNIWSHAQPMLFQLYQRLFDVLSSFTSSSSSTSANNSNNIKNRLTPLYQRAVVILKNMLHQIQLYMERSEVKPKLISLYKQTVPTVAARVSSFTHTATKPSSTTTTATTTQQSVHSPTVIENSSVNNNIHNSDNNVDKFAELHSVTRTGKPVDVYSVAKQASQQKSSHSSDSSLVYDQSLLQPLLPKEDNDIVTFHVPKTDKLTMTMGDERRIGSILSQQQAQQQQQFREGVSYSQSPATA